jgi:hypothetical protein
LLRAFLVADDWHANVLGDRPAQSQAAEAGCGFAVH